MTEEGAISSWSRRCAGSSRADDSALVLAAESKRAGSRSWLLRSATKRTRGLLRGLTFELTPTAEASLVRPGGDDGTAGAARPYKACRSGSGVERVVRPRSSEAHLESPASIVGTKLELGPPLRKVSQTKATTSTAASWAGLSDGILSAHRRHHPC